MAPPTQSTTCPLQARSPPEPMTPSPALGCPCALLQPCCPTGHSRNTGCPCPGPWTTPLSAGSSCSVHPMCMVLCTFHPRPNPKHPDHSPALCLPSTFQLPPYYTACLFCLLWAACLCRWNRAPAGLERPPTTLPSPRGAALPRGLRLGPMGPPTALPRWTISHPSFLTENAPNEPYFLSIFLPPCWLHEPGEWWWVSMAGSLLRRPGAVGARPSR